MKESILSNSEKLFILKAISEGKRLDGRGLDEFRKLRITFGSDWGSCLVTLGETKVLAQVSCEVQQPKPTRPNEGLLLVFVELSPMAAPHFEVGRQSDMAITLNRLLEKCIKDSRCLDLESLCITAEEKVWAIRVDVSILNHEGNLVDAASIAALAGLAHFKRPDVTTTGEQTIIHDPAERDPIPITLHHHPVCVSYAIFNERSHKSKAKEQSSDDPSGDPVPTDTHLSHDIRKLKAKEQNSDDPSEGDSMPVDTHDSRKSKVKEENNDDTLEEEDMLLEDTYSSNEQCVLADPTAIEERVSVGQLIFGMNAYQELCVLHLKGNGQVTTQLVLKCASCAAKRALEVVNHLKKSLEDDLEARNAGKTVGFGEYIQSGDLLSLRQENLCVQLDSKGLKEMSKSVVKMKPLQDTNDTAVVMQIAEGSAELVNENQDIKKAHDDSVEESSSSSTESSSIANNEYRRNTLESMSDSDVEVVAEFSSSREKKAADVESIELSGDSEEDETIILHGEELNTGSKSNKSTGKVKSEKSAEDNVQSRGWYSKSKW